MSGIAGIFNVPLGQKELDTWASVHARHHVDINRYIYQKTKLSLPEYVLEPIDPDNTKTWEEHHLLMHQNQDALLGIAGYDLSGVDFNDRDNLTAWIQLNAIEHRQADDLLRISVPVLPNLSIASTFQSHAESGVGSASGYSFAGMSFGPASSGRILIACLTWGNGLVTPVALTGAAIGGVIATTLITQTTGGCGCAIVAAAVPTGTSGTVAFSLGGTVSRGAAVVYSLANRSAVGASFVTSSTATNPHVAFDVTTGGSAIAVAANFSQFNPSGTWTGLTENSDNTIPPGLSGLGVLGCTAASKNFTSTTAALPIQCAFSVPFGAVGPSSGCFAYFAPGS